VPPSSKGRSQLPALTGLRALAAVWVVLFHYRPDFISLFPVIAVLTPAVGKGFFAVDLFFVLSGFILAYTYFGRYRGHRSDYLTFLSHRIARIYPVHLFTLVLLLALLGGAELIHASVSSGRYDVPSFFYNLFLVHSWGFLDWDTWNQPSWSLSAEWFAYVFIFPLSWIALRRVTRARYAVALMLLAIAALVAWNFSPLASSLARFAVRVSCEFFAGACLYVLFRRNAFKTEFVAEAGFAASIALAWFVPVENQWLTPLMVLCFVAIIIGLSRGQGWLSAALGSKPMLYAGEVSFSLYMMHVILLKVFKIVLPAAHFVHSSPGLRLAVILAYLVSIALVAVLTYEWIERPAREKLRGVFEPRRSSSRAVSANAAVVGGIMPSQEPVAPE
jgi:peptidoglycan/LPS O-acetylase OafA/YrhL